MPQEMKVPSETTCQVLDISVLYKAVLIFMYLGLNIVLNMLNKWTLSLYGFRFPLAMSIAHMAFSFLALAPIMALPSFRVLHSSTLQRQWPGLLAIAMFFALNIGLNNISLLSVSLSLNQVIRASIPIVSAFGSIFIEKQVPTGRELLSLVILFLGVAVAVWEGSMEDTAVLGLVLCILGTISNGLMMSSIGKLMTEKLDVLRLSFYTAPITCILLVPFFFFMEWNKLAEYQRTHSLGYLGLLLLGCVTALAYNMTHALVIKVTSAVTTTVIGEMKIVLILVLSGIMLGESDIWTVHMIVGCITAILGFCMYSHAKLAAAPSMPSLISGNPELGTSLSDSTRAPLLYKPGSSAM